MVKQKALETKRDPGRKVFEAGEDQFLGFSRILHVELPTLMVCLAWLRAKSMRVGDGSNRGADVGAKRPSTGL